MHIQISLAYCTIIPFYQNLCPSLNSTASADTNISDHLGFDCRHYGKTLEQEA